MRNDITRVDPAATKPEIIHKNSFLNPQIGGIVRQASPIVAVENGRPWPSRGASRESVCVFRKEATTVGTLVGMGRRVYVLSTAGWLVTEFFVENLPPFVTSSIPKHAASRTVARYASGEGSEPSRVRP